MEITLDWDYLHEILDYDEGTGIFRWNISRPGISGIGSQAGCVRSDGYILICIEGVLYLAHRLAWFYVYGKWPIGFIDHIDGCPSHNDITNLRESTCIENQQNRKKAQRNNSSDSSIPGVSFRKDRQKYQVRLQINGKTKHFGCFTLLEDAEAECIKQRRIYYEFNTL